MRRVYIMGAGAVSPAGWRLKALSDAMAAGQPLPVESLDRPGWKSTLRVRHVPAPAARPPFFAQPRLRRASPITQYAAGAVLEAVESLNGDSADGRLGLFCCLQSGTVQYAFRFFSEAVRDPLTASPLLFPETVFAAPASHIAALLGKPVLVHTFMGDPGTVLQAVGQAACYISEGKLDACVVVAAEESTWLHSDAMWHLDRGSALSVGAGAVCLAAKPSPQAAIELKSVTDAVTYNSATSIATAAQRVRAALDGTADLLCDSRGGARVTDAAEETAWRDWAGARLSPKRVVGEGLTAGAAWQCALAWDLLRSGTYRSAHVSVVGCNQQAIGLKLTNSSAA